MPEYEYAFVWAGQDNGRPWGSKAQGFGQAPHLNLAANGIDLVDIEIEAGEHTGNGKVLTVATTLEPDAWIGAQLRLGTTAAPLGGYATVIANTATSLTVSWAVDAAAGPATVAGYLVRASELWKTYPSVRVLTPYQPETDTASSSTIAYPTGTVRAPGYTVPASITSYEDLGLFLEFSFLEGIASHGVSEATDSYAVPVAHEPSGATPTSFSLTGPGANLVDKAFAGGYLRVVSGASLQNLSWARIATNTNSTFTLSGAWQGSGQPTGGLPDTWLFEAWVPHWQSSPHSYLPGVGFRYPSNDMQPAVFGDGRIRNLPRGITTSSYGDRFGAMLEFGFRMSQTLGKRVNIIHLAVNESTLRPNNDRIDAGFEGTLGWWDSRLSTDWAITRTDGLAGRLQKLIGTVAPAAMTAEGNTIPLRVFGIVLPMGERDALSAMGRQTYGRQIKAFADWLRGVIGTAGLSPYTSPAKIPILHPQISATPWEAAGNDADGLVNTFISEFAVSDGFSATIAVADSPKLTGDTEHFNGVGEAINGANMAAAMAILVDGASELDSSAVDLEICNLALSHIGETAKVTSLDTTVDTTRQAELCAQFYPRARNALLEEYQWGFLLKRAAGVPSSVTPPEQWLYSYAVPGEAARIVAVLPEGARGDFGSLVVAFGLGLWELDVQKSVYTPQPFIIEQTASGEKVVYTNTPNAVLRYVVKYASATRFPEQFKMAVSWHLASLLAGPIMKGEEGAQQARLAGRVMRGYLGSAAVNDAQQRQQAPDHIVPWLADR